MANIFPGPIDSKSFSNASENRPANVAPEIVLAKLQSLAPPAFSILAMDLQDACSSRFLFDMITRTVATLQTRT
jgi:hypothetical protein